MFPDANFVHVERAVDFDLQCVDILPGVSVMTRGVSARIGIVAANPKPQPGQPFIDEIHQLWRTGGPVIIAEDNVDALVARVVFEGAAG